MPSPSGFRSIAVFPLILNLLKDGREKLQWN